MEYQICNRCIMDNKSDPNITFGTSGNCNYCNEAIERMSYTYFPNEEGKSKLATLLSEIKASGKGKKFDCLMGISGGLDSSYLAYLGVRWGLRILAVHIDDGFDAPVAVDNIRKLCNSAAIELITVKPDSEQFNDLTRAYILAGVPNIAIPQDNILFAYLYKYARKYKLKYFLSGSNFSLESVLQTGNSHSAMDLVNLKDIHKKYGTLPINKLIFLSENKRMIDRFLYGIKTVKPLNYIDYNKEVAIKELKEFCDFNYYEAKHLENTLTKVTQLYWLYHKFGVDKRKSHLSSLIVSGQMTREAALNEMLHSVYDKDKMVKDIDFVLNKLQISKDDFDGIIGEKGHQHTEYKISKPFLLNFARTFLFFNKLKNKLQS